MKKTFILFGIVVTLGCTPRMYSDDNNCETILTLSSDPSYRPHRASEIITGNYGVYSEILSPSQFQIGVSSHIDGIVQEGEHIAYYSGESQVRENNQLTKGLIPQGDNFVSYINGKEITQSNLTEEIATKGMLSAQMTDVFGKTSVFSFSNNPSTKSSLEETEMYVPQKVRISSPASETMDDLYPLCAYNKFVLRWNIDENNSNGMILAVTWNGTMILGEDIEDTSVTRVCHIPDTGEAHIPSSFFDGIPDTAFCTLLLLRGNIKNTTFEEGTCKIIGEAHHMISFILIREATRV